MNRNQVVWVLATLVLSGCFGSNSDTSEDHPLAEDVTKPFIEATIEYPGPHEQWTGPQNFMVRVTTWKAGKAQIIIHPPMIHSEGNRISHYPPQGTRGVSIETVREEFARLYLALRTQEQSFQGCLLPVRVKLVRVDGVIVERQACRGQGGWPKVASEITNHFIELAMASQGEKGKSAHSK